MRLPWLAALLLLVAAGCGTSPVPLPGVAGDPADPAAEIRPDLIVADPKVVEPGEVVGLTFPQETTRGVHFVLERQAGAGTWAYRYDLLSDGPGAGWERRWFPAGAEGFAVEDIGVGGPGPDRVVIPETAEPGTWRICTGNAGENFCAPIEIVAP